MKPKYYYLINAILFLGFFLIDLPQVQAAEPIVSNVKASQRLDGSKLVDIYYDVEDADSAAVTVSVKISDDDGITFLITPVTLSGDVGEVAPGKNKHIVWDCGQDLPGRSGDYFKAAVTAYDSSENITINIPGLPSGAKPLEIVLIPAGTFTMGSPNGEPGRNTNEGPQHQVTITKPFYMGKYEVTQAQWQAVMGANPSNFKGNNLPVENVSWDDCQNFLYYINKLGQGTFRLPTEAEWEYACRAGTTTRFYWGDDPSYTQIKDYAWYDGNNSPSGTKEVGLKLPNAFGLYDMSGNVWEWCQDWYGSYSSASQIDPAGANSGLNRVLRGGFWEINAWSCRSAHRYNETPDVWHIFFGFRLVRTYDQIIATPTPISPTPTPVPPTPTPVAAGETITINITGLPSGSTPLEMVLIPAGTFTMGSPDNEPDRDSDEGPQHQVTLTKAFYMGKYEVTQAQWLAVMGSNPESLYGVGSNYPVHYVSWNDCLTFIQKLNQTGQGTFRLPTEAEWEYACRAGTITRFYWGDDPNSSLIYQYAWFQDNSNNSSHEVGLKYPNAWGLHDISGNVWEWCQDWYGSYSSASQNDPYGANSGSYRILRGGCWNLISGNCRSADRVKGIPDSGNSYSGFRVCRTQ
ncbi:MAG: formylglycine-generating enzyme family protein [Candidatus Omnitrophota bacterium]